MALSLIHLQSTFKPYLQYPTNITIVSIIHYSFINIINIYVWKVLSQIIRTYTRFLHNHSMRSFPIFTQHKQMKCVFFSSLYLCNKSKKRCLRYYQCEYPPRYRRSTFLYRVQTQFESIRAIHSCKQLVFSVFYRSQRGDTLYRWFT